MLTLNRFLLISALSFVLSIVVRAEEPKKEEAMSGAMTGAMMSGEGSGLPVEGQMPPLTGDGVWLNSEPLTPERLRGKVVLIDFWTYSCINCLRAMPYVKSWYERYKDHGLVVVGIHAPEFDFEKNVANVRRAMQKFGVTYPVVLDTNYSLWKAFNNRYWPAHYFVDAEGKIRGHHFGEGNYKESEELIRQLLTDAGVKQLPAPVSGIRQEGVQAAASHESVESPETYIGYGRAENFVSPGGALEDGPKAYAAPDKLKLNDWALGGNWTVEEEKAMLNAPAGKIVFRFKARDLHLVLGPGSDGKAVRFRVTVDGKAPARDHGVDVDEKGNGVVHEQRLYQLIRQSGEADEHTFVIEFLDAGAQAYAFTFG